MSPFDFAATPEWQPLPLSGPGIDFIQREIRRVGASEGELRQAMSLLASEANLEPRAYATLSKRMRRLVDLLALAGPTRDQLLPAELAEPAVSVPEYAGAILAPISRAGLAGR